MARKDREGWKDEASSEGGFWRSGRSSSPSGRILFKDADSRGAGPSTVPWDGGWGQHSGAVAGPPTEIPETLKELFGILVFLSGPRRFDLRPIHQRKVTIGRDGADIIVDDRSVSNQHAVITVAGNSGADGEFRILDRGADGLPSRTGTKVNGRHATESVLQDRDRIQIGETELMFIRAWPEVH
jgi:hypothetical protein